MRLLLLTTIAILLLAQTKCEKIHSLPGLNYDLNFKQYAGFLKVSDTRFLFYWMVESQGSPAKDPVLFWFNGGPGCSSLGGLLQEMGPFLANEDGHTLRQNPYAWNKFASVVYIESPVGVGFSYATNGNISSSDDSTTGDSYEALKQFFRKFPQYRNNDVYIFGESYGGAFAPMLGNAVVQGQANFSIQLKGVGIGNGVVHENLFLGTRVPFLYGHGVYDTKQYSHIKEVCCNNTCTDDCDFGSAIMSGDCLQMALNFQNEFTNNLNYYDIYRDCDIPTDGRAMFPYPCVSDINIRTYLNLPAVRAALGIPANMGQWELCNDYHNNHYIKQYNDMTPFVQNIVNAGVRVLLYYGDADMTSTFLMGDRFSAQLGYQRVIDNVPWYINGQLGGMKSVYEGVTFVTGIGLYNISRLDQYEVFQCWCRSTRTHSNFIGIVMLIPIPH